MSEANEYIRRLETSVPTAPGMYLSLYHGRSSPEEELDDWGSTGPMIGPLEYCHITYLSTINICALGDDNGTGPLTGGHDDILKFHNDLLYYDGVYYGDWELAVHGL